MEIAKGTAVLLRAEKGPLEADPYVEALTTLGLTTQCISVLSFTFTQLAALTQALMEPHAGLILTSPRAGEAMEKALDALQLEERDKTMLQWKDKPCYVVGKVTAKQASSLGLCVLGEDAGSAEKLIPIILQHSKIGHLPLLFPCGNLRRETIPASLSKKGVTLNSITVYETSPDPSIMQKFTMYQKSNGVPEYVVFYSPSGVAFAHPVIQQLRWPHTHMKMIAIGPTTEEAMRHHGIEVTAASNSPSPNALKAAIESLQHTGSDTEGASSNSFNSKHLK